jgi:hypothetical protein
LNTPASSATYSRLLSYYHRNNSNNNNMTKSVYFGSITILEFPIVLGENPSCSSGVPIQIGWKPVERNTFDIAMYDYLRESQRRPRKSLRISIANRALLLMQAGYSIDQIVDAVMKVQVIQKQRTESLQSTGLGERVQLLMETTGKLPMELMRGVLRMAKPKQNTLQARSA